MVLPVPRGPSASSKTGVTTVTSGRWVPPWYGSLIAYTSPGRRSSPRRRRTSLIDSPMEPRWTGMWGALAMRLPSASKSAQEKSRRSLMLTDWAVFSSRTPICSAMAMKRLLKTSRRTGSTSVPAATRAGRGATRCRRRCPVSVTAASQPLSTTVVESGSTRRAGPSTVSPGRRSSRRWRGASWGVPALCMRTVARGAAGPARSSGSTTASMGTGPGGPARPTASTETASTTSGRSMVKAYRAR